MATIESDLSRLAALPPDPTPLYTETYDAPPPLESQLDDPSLNPTPEQIQTTFIKGIESGQSNVVELLLQSGLVEVNPTFGRTPLAAAVATGQTTLARLLITKHAAEVDRFSEEGRDSLKRFIFRTPLMLAAERGSLPLVKMLMEEFGARDEVLAPDGMNALRLAVLKGEEARAVVEYLPVRRGGGWLRFKHEHYAAVRRVKKSTEVLVAIGVFFLWRLPRAILWKLPKYIIIETTRGMKHFVTETLPHGIKKFSELLVNGGIKLANGFKSLVRILWDFTKSIPRRSVELAKFLTKTTPAYIYHLCKTVAVKMTGAMKHFFTVGLPYALSVSWRASLTGAAAFKDALIAGAQALRKFFFTTIPNATAATGKALWRFTTVHFPRFVKACAKLAHRIAIALAKWSKSLVTERIPRVATSFARLIAKGLKAASEMLARGAGLVVSSIHTFLALLISRLGRVTFSDFISSLKFILRFLLIELPQKISYGAVAGYNWTLKAIEKLFGWVGEAVVLLFKCLAGCVLYIPVKIILLLVEFLAWMGRGLREVMVWINPKSGF